MASHYSDSSHLKSSVIKKDIMIRSSNETLFNDDTRNSFKGYIYILDKAPAIIKDILDNQGWIEHDPAIHAEDEWNLWWRGYRPKPSEYKRGRSYQKFNHFPKLNLLGTKDNLNRVMKHEKFTPLTFILPNDYSKFVSEYTSQDVPAIWIWKPTNSSRGRRIFLITDIGQLVYDSAWILQKYINNPLLINGYKWDMRIYVLVTSIWPLKIYLYNEGLIRFWTEKYSWKSLDNKFSHLTNTSINKYGPNIDAK